ncbi:glycosyltransferase family 2 protein [Candidatus Falkowbacteria bacterium]|uniref:dolichyl-phosphate beta-glucosyltransferase n=1 Tax=Candidatus Falkowbacteria bacterium CG10_big_fil_rev_8_21_14_0_10_37_18 TaxID=1974562 RepID=A0A2H0VB15_9BACT|nr:glycosyltransferase family 2 protein [Candidatus Falkowbacteria bacterium]NCQ12612.1 glycosyltransferase family 2 protein [Candidatus Falkowbacteria bacterium]OIO05561.1 MAG: hypothetical protein AUJ26_02660 [Candidatus Falkowbacteria bacterium CG1_02_37_21]PIR95500.1 MAG: hypothetical protein COT93_02195 [Candidatus Falkowbacteria bacterium CG10_big_fil_rev_8_21_14_0_10_37_18]
MSWNKNIAVIIPAYNEASRLDQAFAEIHRFLPAHPELNLEIIFVDDGSLDNTANIINDFVLSSGISPKVRLINYSPNHGKGYAVKQGIMAASPDYYLIADADMSTSLFELEKFLPLMAQGLPVIIGTRKEHGAVLIKKQPWHRQKMGEIYSYLAQFITGLKIKDFGCGFKVFSYEAAQKVFAPAIIDRWIWDTEILFLAKKYGYEIREVGINWADDANTRVGVIKESFRSLADLIKIYWRHK